MSELLPKETANAVPLLWHFSLDGAGGLSQESESQNKDNTCLQWVHLRSDADGAADTMRNLGLSDNAIDAMTASETRPRTMQTEDGLLVYLRGINKNPSADPDDMVSLRLWLTNGLIVSARRKDRKLLSVQDVRQSLEKNQGPKNQGEFICILVERIAERIGEAVDDIDEELTAFETQLADEANIDRQKLAVLRRQSASLRRYLAPQRDALDTLYRSKNILNEDQAFALREQTDRMTRYVEDLDLARERAILLQEELRNRIAEQQSVRMYVLSLVTAVFLPLSFLTGVFGMNVAGLPGLEEPSAFTILASAMLVLAAILVAVMAWKKWV